MAMIYEVLLGLLVANLFVLILCVGIAGVSRLFRASGKVTLEVGEKKLSVERGQSLLNACFANEIYLPAACGGKGTCGKCGVRVAGAGALTPLERLSLTKEDIEAGLRLGCQVRVRRDLTLELAVGQQLAKGFKAKLLAVQAVGGGVKVLEFEVCLDEEGEESEVECWRRAVLKKFLPGQYVQIKYEQPWDLVLRAYSLSSVDLERGRFTLDVRLVQGGLVSGMLHRLEVGEVLEFSGPFGDMCLSDGGEDEKAAGIERLVLVAGGVGLAPMRYLVKAALKLDFKEVALFHGATGRDGLYYEREFEELGVKDGRFKYFAALAQPRLQDGWRGYEGMIHGLVDETPFEVEGGLAMICGPKPMMEAVEKILIDKGFSSDRILADPFDF